MKVCVLPIPSGLLAICVGVAIFASRVGAEPPVTALACAPDGTCLVAGSQAGLVVYRWPDLDHPRIVKTDVGCVHDIAFSPDGRQLAVAGGEPSQSGVCEIVTWPESEQKARFTEHEDLIYALAWKNDGRSLATASMDSTVIVTSFAPKTADSASETIATLSRDPLQQRLTGHSRGVLAACFLPEGPYLLTGSIDQSIRLWSTDTAPPELVRTHENHTAAVYDLAVRPAPASTLPMVASVGQDRTVRLWQPTIGRLVRFTRIPDAVPLSAAWFPDGSQLVVACSDGCVRLIDPDTIEVKRKLPAHSGWCYSVTVHPTTGDIVVGGPEGVRRVVRP